MDTFLITKLIVVFIFLIMFWRGSRLFWGIGLLAVTTAVLLDTFLDIFGREEMLANIGSFIYIINGALFMGGLIWLWGLLRPALSRQPAASENDQPLAPRRAAPVVGRAAPVTGRAAPVETETADVADPEPETPAEEPIAPEPVVFKRPSQVVETAFDRQMLYEQMRYRLGTDDLRNLIFDLGINENDVVGLNQDAHKLILNLMDLAEERGQGGQLALAVERILAPLPAESLPRLEKINEDSPPNILRYYLLAHYKLAELMSMAAELDIDWDDLPGKNRQSKTREMLLYLMRRNRLSELIDLMHSQAA
jgi:hypothetical protein